MKEKMNLKLRAVNWAFWWPLVAGVLSMIMGFLNMQPQDFSTWESVWLAFVEFIKNPYFVVSVILYVITALIDPTTPGISDSHVSLAKESLKETASDVLKKESK